MVCQAQKGGVMNLNQVHKKTVSWLVLCSFIMLLHGCTAQLRGDNATRNENSAIAAVPGAGDELAPGTMEKVSMSGKTVGKKKIPWLLIAAGAVVVAGVDIYFTLIYKPKYALTITLSEGVTGTPAAGTVEYKKGKVVDYNFTAVAGYKKLAVTLDGVSVDAAGTVTMDKAHTLSAMSIEGFDDQFTSSASTLWKPWHPAAWSVSGGYYKCSAMAPDFSFEHNVLDYRFQQNQFIAETKLRRTAGLSEPFVIGIALVTSTNMTNTSGYFFYLNLDPPAQYSVYKYTNKNFETPMPVPESTIKAWTSSTYINYMSNYWNTLRVTRSGSDYTLAINGYTIFIFSDSSHDVRYFVQLGAIISLPMAWEIDYVTISMGSTPTAIPMLPAAMDVLVSSSPHKTMTGRRKQE